MKRILCTFMLFLMAGTAWAGHPIASAQYTDSGMIHVTLADGRELDVPDDLANRHRRWVAQWVSAGNAITPADPPVPLTRRQKIRRDPDFPKPAEFVEAFIDCRFNSDCTAAQTIRNRLSTLRAKYP